MIGTQMNADFQDSIKIKTFFGVYLRKWASLEAIKIFSNIFSGLKRLPRNPSQPPKGGEVFCGNSINHEAFSPFERGR
jgi:hypothetical protein